MVTESALCQFNEWCAVNVNEHASFHIKYCIVHSFKKGNKWAPDGETIQSYWRSQKNCRKKSINMQKSCMPWQKWFLWFINPLFKQGNELWSVRVLCILNAFHKAKFASFNWPFRMCNTWLLVILITEFQWSVGLNKDFAILTVSFQPFALFFFFCQFKKKKKPAIFNPFSLLTLALI